MYWNEVCKEMEKYVIDVLDTEELRALESGSLELKQGIYMIKGSGSYYAEWEGDKWYDGIFGRSRLEKEIRRIWDLKYKD